MENNIEFKYILMKDNDGNIIEGYRFRMQDPDYLVDIPMHIFNFIKNIDNKKQEKENLADRYVDPYDEILRKMPIGGSLFEAEWKSRIEKERKKNDK
jgi:hypothetical protein